MNCYFFGTFNPIHLGHIEIARQVKEKLGFEKIIFVPSFMPPHKVDDLETFIHRLEMVKLAAGAENTSDIETLTGTGEGSVTQIVNTRVATLVGGDTLSHESLGDMATWISSHSTSAEDMEDEITANEEDIAVLLERVNSSAYEYEVDDINFTDVTSIVLTGEDTVAVGSEITVTSTVNGVVWSSNNDAIATVEGGVVRGVSAGEVTITASAEGYESGSKTVTVNAVV